MVIFKSCTIQTHPGTLPRRAFSSKRLFEGESGVRRILNLSTFCNCQKERQKKFIQNAEVKTKQQLWNGAPKLIEGKISKGRYSVWNAEERQRSNNLLSLGSDSNTGIVPESTFALKSLDEKVIKIQVDSVVNIQFS
jgi:hypothetical protein